MAEESKQGSAAGDYLGALSKSQGSNRDTEGLGVMAIAGGGLIIGSVYAINGQDGEVVEFPVTRHELHALADYWWTERIENTSGSSSSANRQQRMAVEHIHRPPPRPAARDPRQGGHGQGVRWGRGEHLQARNISDEEWEVFTERTREEQDAWREKLAGTGRR